MTLIIFGLFAYTMYVVTEQECRFEWTFTLLEKLLDITYWILYAPFLEAFIGIFKCSDEHHKVVTGMSCYGGVHITFIVISMIFSCLVLVIAVFCSILYTETNTVKDNVVSRIDDGDELLIVAIRLFLIIYTTFVQSVLSPSP